MKRILTFLILVLTAYIGQSTAFDWSLYGMVGSGIWWMKSYKYYDDTIPTETDPVTGDTLEFISGKDPFPVNVGDFLTYGTFGIKTKGDRFTGVVEMGIHVNAYDTKANKSNYVQYYYKKFNSLVSLKKWYFEWYFNDYISILGGQDFSPTCFFASEQRFYDNNSFSNIGCMYTGRNPMIQFSIHHPELKWNAKVAVVKIDTTNLRIRNKGGEDLNGDSIRYYSEVRIPKTEGSFEFNLEKDNIGLNCKFAGGFQRYYQLGMHFQWFEKGAEKYPVDAYVMGADIRVKLGIFGLALDGFLGQNVGTYGAYIGDAFGWWFASEYMFVLMPISDINKDGRFSNSKIYEIAAILSLTPVQNLIFEGGAGTVQGKHEFGGYNERWHPTYAWYFHTRYKILDKLEITPEIGQYIYGPQFGFGKYTYWGLNTFIEF